MKKINLTTIFSVFLVFIILAISAYADNVTIGVMNKAPVITGVSGPTQLKVGETGTWTVNAYDPENGYLNYYVYWGDEALKDKINTQKATSTVQSSTFTHVYYDSGDYSPQFIVQDAQGLYAYEDVNVKIGQNACAIESVICVVGTHPEGYTGDDGCTHTRCVTDAKICCKSYGLGSMMAEVNVKYEMIAKDSCKIPEGLVGGRKEIVDNSYCAKACPTESVICVVGTHPEGYTGDDGCKHTRCVTDGKNNYDLGQLIKMKDGMVVVVNNNLQLTLVGAKENTIRCIRAPCPSNSITVINAQIVPQVKVDSTSNTPTTDGTIAVNGIGKTLYLNVGDSDNFSNYKIQLLSANEESVVIVVTSSSGTTVEIPGSGTTSGSSSGATGEIPGSGTTSGSINEIGQYKETCPEGCKELLDGCLCPKQKIKVVSGTNGQKVILSNIEGSGSGASPTVQSIRIEPGASSVEASISTDQGTIKRSIKTDEAPMVALPVVNNGKDVEVSIESKPSTLETLISTSAGSAKTRENIVYEDSKIYVQKGTGTIKKEIKIMPGAASSIATDNLKQQVDNIVLTNMDKPIYEVSGNKEGRLLGIFNINYNVKTQVDADSGNVVGTETPWYAAISTE